MTDKVVTVRLPYQLIDDIKTQVINGRYLNPTEFVRVAVREKLEREEGRTA